MVYTSTCTHIPCVPYREGCLCTERDGRCALDSAHVHFVDVAQDVLLAVVRCRPLKRLIDDLFPTNSLLSPLKEPYSAWRYGINCMTHLVEMGELGTSSPPTINHQAAIQHIGVIVVRVPTFLKLT